MKEKGFSPLFMGFIRRELMPQAESIKMKSEK